MIFDFDLSKIKESKRKQRRDNSWDWLNYLDPEDEEYGELEMLIQDEWHGSR